MADAEPLPSARALLQERDYLFFWATRFMGGFGSTVQSVTMGALVYVLSRQSGLGIPQSAFNVSLIGLITFAPLFFLALPAGETADRYDRKLVLMICYALEAVVVGALLLASLTHHATVPLLLTAAVFFGVGRAFMMPTSTALGPMLVPRELLPRAIAWNSLSFQTSSILGAALGGVFFAISPSVAFATTLVMYLGAAVALAMIRGRTRADAQVGSRWELVKEGVAYVWHTRVIFGAISLDLAAVILGGATALMPAFAFDVLHVGAAGVGILRAGQGAGAMLVTFCLAANPIRARAGIWMFGGVAVFGAATVVFGVSHWLWLSVVALAILGGADALSVYVRQTLVQLVTPDHMRGRVAAVSTLFISASNELGEFESGLIARFFGPVGSAIFGGVGALVVTGAWAILFPTLRKADRLE